MRIAWVTPLPPVASGIADYSYELLALIAERADVTAVSPRPGRFRRPRIPEGVAWTEPSRWAGVADGFDTVFYHLGNNPFHRFVYELAMGRPGVAVFHDFVMHHLLAGMLVEKTDTRDPVRYERLLRADHGEAGARFAKLRFRRIATDFEKFLFPLSGHIARAARAMVLHSHESAARMLPAAPGVPATVIPHYAPAPPPEMEGVSKEAARRMLGLPEHAFVVGHFGFVTRPKQPGALIGGFSRLVEKVPDAQLVIVGANHSGGGLDQLLVRNDVRSRVRMTGFVDLLRFHRYLRAVDAVVNLRYPTAGESSGTVARALREGLPVIVNNIGSFAELDEDLACKVEVDDDQTEQVATHLIRLAEDQEYRARVSQAARRYARTVLDPGRCAGLYLGVAEQSAAEGTGRVEPTWVPPRPIAGGGDPREAVEAMQRHRERRTDIDRLIADAVSPAGSAIHVDLVYRLLLRRPAEEHVLRESEMSVAAMARTRAELARWVLQSQEFHELELTEKTVQAARRSGEPFEPDGRFGPDTTERAVEIPWVLSRIGEESRVLDLGYAYASGLYLSGLLSMPIERLHGTDRSVAEVPGMIRTLADVRALPYRDDSFGSVICLSTIEHVGLDNTRYGIEGGLGEGGDVQTIRELERVLRPGGRLFITVPFGLRQDESWFVQYDRTRWEALVANTALEERDRGIYQLTERGWGPASEIDVLERLSYGVNAPAAQGVLCAVLVKPSPE